MNVNADGLSPSIPPVSEHSHTVDGFVHSQAETNCHASVRLLSVELARPISLAWIPLSESVISSIRDLFATTDLNIFFYTHLKQHTVPFITSLDEIDDGLFVKSAVCTIVHTMVDLLFTPFFYAIFETLVNEINLHDLVFLVPSWPS